MKKERRLFLYGSNIGDQYTLTFYASDDELTYINEFVVDFKDSFILDITQDFGALVPYLEALRFWGIDFTLNYNCKGSCDTYFKC